MNKLVVKTDGLLETADSDIAVLEQAGLRFAEGTYLTEDELIDACGEASGLLVLREPITERVLGALPNLAVIARFGVGLDSIDTDAAARRGVVVTNVPDANVHEVATHAVTLATSLVRRIGDYDAEVRAGGWRFQLPGRDVHRLTSLTFGVLGLGQIGRQTGAMASALGYRVQAHDPAIA
ncbi:MAG: C-terminal binding protein, partial [Actinomycetia bacterium]|nr:C-terminal binding protein [Actinomycetes bacterium]